MQEAWTFTENEFERYARHLTLKEVGLAGQTRLKNARVLCVGAGGLGSPLLLYLAAAGVGTIGIIEDGKVELSNLQRQVLYQTQHLNQHKVFVAKEQLLNLNPEINIEIYPTRLTLDNAENILKNYSLVADCTDNFATRYLINEVCCKLSLPFVFAAIDHYQGMLAFFSGKEGPCYACLFPENNATNTCLNCNEAGVLGVIPGIIGTLQGGMILNSILNLDSQIEDKLFLVHPLTMQIKTMQLKRDPHCHYCKEKNIMPSNPFQHEENQNLEITAQELKKILAENVPFQFIDVRTPQEHTQSNIGGVNLPIQELPHRIAELNKSKLTVVYCLKGPRSKMAAELLQAAGFAKVKYLVGGVEKY